MSERIRPNPPTPTPAQIAKPSKSIETNSPPSPIAPDIAASGRIRERHGKAPQDDDPNKPPRVLPNTYWTRKGGGWILEYKRKVKRKVGSKWLYEYFGLIDLDLWNKLKGRFDNEKLANILKGIIGARRTELQRARDSQAGRPRLRLVGKR